MPLVDCTLNHCFRRLDFGVDEFSPQRTRGAAATLLGEHRLSRDGVESLLAHTETSETPRDAFVVRDAALAAAEQVEDGVARDAPSCVARWLVYSSLHG